MKLYLMTFLLWGENKKAFVLAQNEMQAADTILGTFSGASQVGMVECEEVNANGHLVTMWDV